MRNKKEELLNAAELLKSFGYRVFVSNSEFPTYLYYTNGKQVAYVQLGDYGGYRFGVEYCNKKENDFRGVIDTWDEAEFKITKELAEEKITRKAWCSYQTNEENAKMKRWESFEEWLSHHQDKMQFLKEF